jgi:hypothetical protein
VNSAIDANTLTKSGFMGLANATFDELHWHLVQDGASCHTSTQSLNALFEICNLFPEWPPNSSDLNPIECLWARSNDGCSGTEFTHARRQSEQFRPYGRNFNKDRFIVLWPHSPIACKWCGKLKGEQFNH